MRPRMGLLIVPQGHSGAEASPDILRKIGIFFLGEQGAPILRETGHRAVDPGTAGEGLWGACPVGEGLPIGAR